MIWTVKTLFLKYKYAILSLGALLTYFIVNKFTAQAEAKAVDSLDFDRLKKDVEIMAEALGTLPGKWTSDEFEETAFIIVSKYRNFRNEIEQEYEKVTGRTYIQDVAELLTNDQVKILISWNYF